MRIYSRASGAYNKNVHRDSSIYCPQKQEQKSLLQDILSCWNFNPANANKWFRINVVGMRTGMGTGISFHQISTMELSLSIASSCRAPKP